MNLQHRIEEVERRIKLACEAVGRARDEIKIVAVTKYVNSETARQMIDSGLMHIGENRTQVAAEKWDELGGQGNWHFIGHLQTNKVRDVIGKFTYFHSLDRLSLAKELEKRAKALGIRVNCFIQFNVSGEQSKYGLAPKESLAFAREVVKYEHLNVIGLMTMAPHETDPEQTRPVFRRLRELKDEMNAASIFPTPLKELSMGMSNDFEIAIQEGATWVRLGSVLVGE